MEFIYFVNEVQLRLCSLLSCNHEQEEDSKYVDFSSLVTAVDSGEGLISTSTCTRHQTTMSLNCTRNALRAE